MDSTTKHLVNAGLNTVSMVAFAIPGGAPVGVALMAGVALFDALTGEPAAKDPAVTRGELKAAVDSVKKAIIDAVWKGQADDITDRVLALNQGFQDVYDAISKIKMDGDRYIFLTTNDTVVHFIENTNAYFDMGRAQDTDGILTNLRSFRSFLELRSLDPLVTITDAERFEHQRQTVALYLTNAALTAAYLKTAVLWNWGQEMLVAWQYPQYLAQLAVWQGMSQQDQLDNPDQDPVKMYPGVNTDTNYHPPTWDTWTIEVNPHPPPALHKIKNCPANLLIDEVQQALAYCVGTVAQPGVYSTILTHLNDLETRASAGETALGSNWATATAVTKAQMIQAAELGADAAGSLAVLTPKYALDKLTEDDILGFGTTIDGLRAAQASAIFHTHKAVKGETLTKIASLEYPNEDTATFAQKLYDANPNLAFDGNASTAGGWLGVAIKTGTFVKIFDTEAYAYLNWKPATKGTST